MGAFSLNKSQTDLSAQWCPQSLKEVRQVLMFILWHTSSLGYERKEVWSYKKAGRTFPIAHWDTWLIFFHRSAALHWLLLWVTALLNGISTIHYPHFKKINELRFVLFFFTRVCSESSFALWTSESSFSMIRGNRNCSKTSSKYT